MKTISYLIGNLLFDGTFKAEDNASIKIVIEETSSQNTVYEKAIPFDKSSLPIFKYLPFELKDFEFEPGESFELYAHMDMDNSGSQSKGDFISEKMPVVTGFEELNLQMAQIR